MFANVHVHDCTHNLYTQLTGGLNLGVLVRLYAELGGQNVQSCVHILFEHFRFDLLTNGVKMCARIIVKVVFGDPHNIVIKGFLCKMGSKRG